MTYIDYSSLMEFLNENKTIKSLSLKSLELGEHTNDHELVSIILLYNETLEHLDLSRNNLYKSTKIFQNLTRNRNSNILHLNLSHNKFEIEEFSIIIKLLEKDS